MGELRGGSGKGEYVGKCREGATQVREVRQEGGCEAEKAGVGGRG